MLKKSLLFLLDRGGSEAITLIRKAIGEHYEVRQEEEKVNIGKGKRVVHRPVIRIYNKGGTKPRLTLWLS